MFGLGEIRYIPDYATNGNLKGFISTRVKKLDEMADYTDKTWAEWNKDIFGGMNLDNLVKNSELMYDGLALAGEAGELANLVKKHFRNIYLTKGHNDPNAIKKIPFELADCLYYMLRICKLLNIDLEKAFYGKMEQNIKRYKK